MDFKTPERKFRRRGWIAELRFNPIRFNSIRFSLIQFDTTRFNSILFDSIRISLIEFEPSGFNWSHFGSNEKVITSIFLVVSKNRDMQTSETLHGELLSIQVPSGRPPPALNEIIILMSIRIRMYQILNLLMSQILWIWICSVWQLDFLNSPNLDLYISRQIVFSKYLNKLL